MKRYEKYMDIKKEYKGPLSSISNRLMKKKSNLNPLNDIHNSNINKYTIFS